MAASLPWNNAPSTCAVAALQLPLLGGVLRRQVPSSGLPAGSRAAPGLASEEEGETKRVATDRDKILQEAQRLVDGKRYDKAAALFQRVLAEDPNDVRVLLKLGDTYLKLELFTDAISTYDRVGQIYASQNSALKAITVYKRVREMIDKHVPALEERYAHILPRLAELYTQLGLTSDALATYDTVATKLQKAGKEREAVDIFRKVVDLDPSNPLAYLRLADAYIRVRDVDNAVKRFGAAAEILARLGRPNDALKVIERLLQHRPEPDWARMAAEIHLNRGGPDDARAALSRLQVAYKDNPRDLSTLSLLARVFDKLGQPAKAIEVMKESARIAREAGKLDAFNALIGELLARAPSDEGVQVLARSAAAPQATRRPSQAAPPQRATQAGEEPDSAVEDVSDDMIEDVEPEPEAPFALPRRPTATAVPSGDPAVRARQLVAQAEALRQTRNYHRAAEVLRHGVLELPAAHELREKLCDILIEAGDQHGAVAEMLVFAEYLAEHGDAPGAARVLDEILLLEPDHADAVLMLSSLGYTLPQPGPEAPLQVDFAPPEYVGPAFEPADYETAAPLPSYDLEEVDPSSAMMTATGSHPAYSPSAARPAAPIAPVIREAPLPRFGLDDEQTEYMDLPPMSLGTIEAQNTRSPLAETGAYPQAAHGQLDEDALEEIEFFTAQGMLEEARALLTEQIAKLPNHPLLLEKKREVDALAAAAASAAAAPHSNESGPRAMPGAGGRTGEDRSFDIAASLDALDSLHEGPGAEAAEPRGPTVDAVIRQFKAGVAAQISPDDAETHYNLGTAYKDMGLFPDAIAEFELAARDPGRECNCRSMIGMIHLQLGNVDAAIDAFLRGLEGAQKTPEQEVALHYEIGSAYEQRKNLEQALYYFQRAARIDPKWRDPRGSVEERIRKLDPTQREKAKAVGDDEMDLDSVFDNLLGSK